MLQVDSPELVTKHSNAVMKAFEVHHTLGIRKTGAMSTKESPFLSKKTTLYKPFTITATDGYIIDMVGTLYAKQNDVDFFLLDDSKGLVMILKKGDIFI